MPKTADQVRDAILAVLRDSQRTTGLNDPSPIPDEPAIGVEDDDGECWFLVVQPA